MELRDLIITPFIILLVYSGAYFVRPHVTDSVNRRYFIPALSVRILGALAMGFIYQFYYHGGDTFNYHTLGSRIVWESFIENPANGLRLIFGSTADELGIYQYSSRIPFFHDVNSYFVIRIAAFFDLLTFSSYSATAVLFSVISFVGMWMLFLTFYKKYPHLHLGIAMATFFIPSVFFWGSGLLKDTLIIGCLGIATYHISILFLDRLITLRSMLVLVGVLYVIFKVRVFVLQAYLPAVILWIMAFNFSSIRSVLVKFMAVPFAAAVLLFSVYYAVVKIGENDAKYSVANLAKTSKITAYDIGFFTGRDAGSRYSLDISDWTPVGMLQVSPAAINVSLFRPYLWEARNPLMFVSSLESAFLLLFSLYVLFKNFRHLFSALGNYNVLFCLVFSITFAFAIGISTFNFGTLTRYRIPLLPFYLLALLILNDYSNSDKKFGVLETTE